MEHFEENDLLNLKKLVAASIEIAIAFWRRTVWEPNVDFWQKYLFIPRRNLLHCDLEHGTQVTNVNESFSKIWSRARECHQYGVLQLPIVLKIQVSEKANMKNIDPEGTAQATCFKYLLSVPNPISLLDFASEMPLIRRKNIFWRNFRFKL